MPRDSRTRARSCEALLSERRGTRVEVRAAARGDKRKLSELAQRNARFALDQDRRRHEQARASAAATRCATCRPRLGLEAPPVRIECYDISNLGDTYAVASMVVFEQGAPAKAALPQLHACATRAAPTTSRACEEVVAAPLHPLRDDEDDPSFAVAPGLVVIDGGKGQLAAAVAGDGRGRRRRACR